MPRIRVCGAPASKGAAMEPFGGARGSKKGERDSKYLDSINRFLRGRAAAPKAAARFMIFLVKAAGRKVAVKSATGLRFYLLFVPVKLQP